MANPLRSVARDAAYVRDVIAGIGKRIVLVAHSYGGFVITEAAAGSDSVVGLVYVCGLAPEHGESAFALAARFPGSTLGPDTANAYPVSTGGNELAIKQEVFHKIFRPGRQRGSGRPHGGDTAARQNRSRPYCDALPTDLPAWKSIPSWFVFGERDLIIPAELHRFMAKRANARSTREIAGASHALSVSQPDAVTASILGGRGGCLSATEPAVPA